MSLYLDSYWTCRPLSAMVGEIKQTPITNENDYLCQVVLQLMTVWYRIVNNLRSDGQNVISKLRDWFGEVNVRGPITPAYNLSHDQIVQLSTMFSNVVCVHRWFNGSAAKVNPTVLSLRAVPGAYTKFENECMNPACLLSPATFPTWARTELFSDTDVEEKILGYLKSLLPNVAPTVAVQPQGAEPDNHPSTPKRTQHQGRTSRLASPVSVRRSNSQPVLEPAAQTAKGTLFSPQRAHALIPSPSRNCISSGHVQGITHSFCKHLDVSDIVRQRVPFQINGKYSIDVVSFLLDHDQIKTPTFLKQFVDSLDGNQKVRLIFANPPWGIWEGNPDAPLDESEIIAFADAFDYILDDKGTVLLQPGPNPEHIACWYKALTRKVCELI